MIFIYFRLTNLNNIKVSSKKKLETDEDSNETDSNNGSIVDVGKNNNSIKPSIESKNEVDKLKVMAETIATIDDIDSGIYISLKFHP